MSGVVFDKGYEELRKLYVRHLAEYPIPYKKLRYYGIKKLLTNAHFDKTEEIAGGYRIFIEKKELMNSLAGDMLQLRIKSKVHRSDYRLISPIHDLSANWDIVTSYYSFFFSALFLMRLLYRGTLFFDKDLKNQIEHRISESFGQVISLESNNTFRIDYSTECIELVKSDGNVHEAVWKEVSKIIGEMLQLSNPQSKERTLLNIISMINTKKGPTFPSKLRNIVNYQPDSVIAFLENEFHKVTNHTDYVRLIENYEYCADEPLDKTINLFSAYHQFIVELADNFFGDYLEMTNSKREKLGYPKDFFY